MQHATPLNGLKVLDLGHWIAGPYCTKLLAGLGANVIKVERPDGGDPARRAGSFPEDRPHPEKSGLYLYLNTGKRSITLNLKSPTGKSLFRQLAQWADVIVENFAPRVMPSLGLGYAHLEEIKPSLVLTSISNFGQTGPYRDYRGNDMTIFAAGGLMHQFGLPEMPPLRFGGNIVQYSGGLAAFAATLIAFYHAELTGEGQQVDISLQEVLACHHFQGMVEYEYTGRDRTRNRTMLIFPASDGWVNAMFFPYMWNRVPDALGMPELLDDPRFRTEESRIQHFQEFETLLLPWMLSHTKEEIYHIGQKARLPFGYLADAKDLIDSPQYRARGFFKVLDHPFAGRQTYPGTPLRVGDVEWQHDRAPLLGEHNEEVYCGLLGYCRADLARLRQNGVI